MAQILCIEDNPDFLEAISYELKSAGHDVIESSCGSEGIELVYEHKPDLIVSDIMMPRMSGLELLIKLRSGENEMSGIPVILISAATHKHYYDEAMKFGVSSFMLKPINWEELLETVDDIFRKKQAVSTSS